MGGPPPHAHHDQATGRPDPIPISRGALRDHLADLDQVYAAIETRALDDAAVLLDGVLCSLHDTLFRHLPDGRIVTTSHLL